MLKSRLRCEHCRSPRGERGLKYGMDVYATSLPSRGAWIEITHCDGGACPIPSLPSRGAWIEILSARGSTMALESLPSRGAWIEIGQQAVPVVDPPVAPLAGSVD